MNRWTRPLSVALMSVCVFAVGCSGGQDYPTPRPTQHGPRPTSSPATASPQIATVLPSADLPATKAVDVRVILPSLSVSRGDVVAVQIGVDPKGLGISSGEITVQFDPSAMQIVAFEPGQLLGATPLVGAERVDNRSGKALYALARVGPTSPPTPQGTIATIKFKIPETAQAGSYDFSLAAAGLADEKFEEINQVAMSGATIVVR